MAQSSSHEMSSVSCVPPWFGRVSCSIEVEDDESSMEEPEVKLGGVELSQRDESEAEAERG
jgi:hypothetical protein